LTEAQRRAATKFKIWRENPLAFAWDNFKIELDEWQKEGLEPCGGAPNPRRRLMLKACTGPGKSTELAIIGWHRLACFGKKGEHPKGAAISGEGRDNLKDNLWAELSKWQQRSDFLKSQFTWTKERIYANDHPEDWFLSARSYAKDATPETIGTALSGLHSNYPFLLMDETGRMPIIVGQKASQIFTGGVVDGLLAGAGNPVSTSGLLYHVANTEAQLWKIITITADPDDPKRTPRVDIAHAREQILLHGRDNPWVMATILGKFPPGGLNTLFGSDEVEAAQGRHIREEMYINIQKRLGVDVALYGDDRTILIPRQGFATWDPITMRTQEPANISGRIVVIKRDIKHEQEFIDDTGGWGSGVISHLKLSGHSPYGVQAAGAAGDPRYYNKRAEMWFEMRTWVRSGGSLPNDPLLKAELTTPQYTMKDGKLLLEPKDMVKKRLGRSPDIADALAQTFAIPDCPSKLSQLATSIPTSHQSQAGRNPLRGR
jgi:phage terminase large subunit